LELGEKELRNDAKWKNEWTGKPHGRNEFAHNQ
jgi:hypothetical protein